LHFSLYGLIGASRKSPCLVIIIIIINFCSTYRVSRVQTLYQM